MPGGRFRRSAGGVADHMVTQMLRQSDAEVFKLYSWAKPWSRHFVHGFPTIVPKLGAGRRKRYNKRSFGRAAEI